MSRLLMTLLTIQVLCNPALGKDYCKELTLSYDKNRFSFVNYNGVISVSSYSYPICYGTNTQEPGLPLVIIHVLIGADEEFVSASTKRSEQTLLSNISISPNPTWVPRNQKKAALSIVQPPVYTQSSYPSEILLYAGTQNAGGYKYISFLVSPFRFFPDKGELGFSNEIKLKITLRKNGKVQFANNSKSMRDVVEDLVVNADELSLLYPYQRSAPSADSIEYLIITSDSLKSSFQKLANWKKRKGVNTIVLGIEEDIEPLYTDINSDGSPNYPMRIKKAIKFYNENRGTHYVLLGGNLCNVPTVQAFLRFTGAIVPDSNCPCDLFYACTQNLNWNTGYKWGAIESNVDINPVVHVTRLPAANRVEAERMINRIISYERNPMIEAWKDSMLMCGAFSPELRYFAEYGRYMTNAEHKGELFYGNLWIYWHGERFRFYDHYTDHPSGANYQLNPFHFSERLSGGYPFVLMDSHGDWNGYLLEEDTFKVQNAFNFINPSFSVIATSACYTNDFYDLGHSDCLGEAFMKNPEGGILAYWGGSDLTFGSENGDFDLGVTEQFNFQFYSTLFFNEDNHLGEVVTNVRKHFFLSENMNYNSPIRWTYLSMNIFGDAEMPIFVHQPRCFDNAEVSYNMEELHIDLHDVVNNNDTTSYRICVMSLYDNGASYYTIQESPIDEFFAEVPIGNDYSVCVTKPGCRPFVINCYNSGYIQNDTIADYSVCYSDNLQIGRNVTTHRPYGAVSVESGASLNIYGINGVTIKNSFEVKPGAVMEIRPGDY